MLKHHIGPAILQAIRQNFGKIAFASTEISLSYEELDRLIGCIAFDMQEAGVGRGSLVAIDTPDSRVAVAAVVASCLLGATWLNGSAAAYAKKGLGITHIYWAGAPDAPRPQHPRLIELNGQRNRGREMGKWLMKLQPASYRSEADICRVGQSSATTGESKFINVTARDMWERVHWESAGVYEAGSVRMACLFPPLSGVGCNQRLRVLMRGGTNVELTGPDRVPQWRTLNTNLMIGSPAQYARLMHEAGGALSPKIRWAMVGGGKPSDRFLQSMFNCFENVTVFYGSTELGHAGEYHLTSPKGYDGQLEVCRNLVTLQVVDSADVPVPAGQEGVVRIRSNFSVPSYINEPVATASSIRNGWFYPGDVGHLDANGFLRVTGRSNEMLNLGGVKVNTLLIDDMIQGFAGVRDGYCFSRTNEFGTDNLDVILTLLDGQDAKTVAEQLLEHCKRVLASNVVPRRIFVSTALPRTDTGKPQRLRAAEMTASAEPVCTYKT